MQKRQVGYQFAAENNAACARIQISVPVETDNICIDIPYCPL
jgi:hypothetical protein